MRSRPLLLAAVAVLPLGACHKGSQAGALDRAASQADPAAAAVMRNAADGMGEEGNGASLSAPDSPAQQALARAGNAAAAAGTEAAPRPAFGTHELDSPAAPATTPHRSGTDVRGAQPHQAGAPVPNTDTPTPVVNHY